MNPVDEQVSRLARIRDDDLRPDREATATLLSSIMSGEDAIGSGGPYTSETSRPHTRKTSRPYTRKRKLALAATTVAVLAAAVVVGPTVLPIRHGPATSYANSAIEIEQSGDEWVARVKDPFADHNLYREAFRAVGLDVGLVIVPVSPPRVGDVVRMRFEGDTTSGEGIGGGTTPEGCELGQDGCRLEVSVSLGFTGRGTLELGRPARSGEKYQDAGSATGKGGMLNGFRVDEQTVGTVLAEVRRRGLRAVFQVITPEKNGEGYSVDQNAEQPRVGDDWWVWDAEPEQEGVVRLLVSKEHVDKNPIYGGPKPPD